MGLGSSGKVGSFPWLSNVKPLLIDVKIVQNQWKVNIL